MKIIEKSVLSTDKTHYLKGKVYLPDGEIKGYFHAVHGMTEHIGRYNELLTFMAENGYIAFGYDNLGHGNTATCEEELGYIAKKDGFKFLIDDVGEFYNCVKSEYGDYPYYLLGHSMGSFIVRLAVSGGLNPNGVIIMGTADQNPLANAGLFIIDVIKLFKGDRHVSKFIDNMAFGSYNEKFKEEGSRRSWLTNDESVRTRYDNDKFCNYRFTLSAMKDLITINRDCNLKKWFETYPKTVKTLIVSGADDPVGNYGKGVENVYNKLVKNGANVSLKIYNGARHEILNDISKQEVLSDLLNFIK